MDVFVARQPILDRAGQLYAYELLFRSSDLYNQFDSTAAGSATTELIAHSLLAIGFENLICGKKAFINFDRSLLLTGLHSSLPREKVVLEILESVEPDAEVVAACRDLRQQGYTIALDDFVDHPKFQPLTETAQVIKVDVRSTGKPEQERLLRKYEGRGIAMLAEKVETYEEFEWAREAGYDLFQGYFFARPGIVRGKQIPAGKVNCLRLLREIQSEDLDFDSLQEIISEDVSLTFKLFRYVNSALFARQSEIDSIRQSLALLGEVGIRHWVTLSTLPALAKGKPAELITHSLVRARFCERLTRLAGVANSNLGFLMGLFSLLDALLDTSLDQALRQAGVTPTISEALLGTSPDDSVCGNVYKLVLRYEAGDWDAVQELAAKLKINASGVPDAYAESTLWASQVQNSSSRDANSRGKTRHRIEGAMSIRWQDDTGRERVSNAKLINVSVHGLQVQVAESIPVQVPVSCKHPKIGKLGTGSVRYCIDSRGKYLIGLHFSKGTGWPGPH